MNDQFKDFQGLLDAKKFIKQRKQTSLRVDDIWNLASEIFDKAEDKAKVPAHFKIIGAGLKKLTNNQQEIYDEIIAELDEEIAKYQTIKTTE